MLIFSNIIMMAKIILKINSSLLMCRHNNHKANYRSNTDGMRKMHPITNHKRKQTEKR
jgi:hypothetical protein